MFNTGTQYMYVHAPIDFERKIFHSKIKISYCIYYKSNRISLDKQKNALLHARWLHWIEQSNCTINQGQSHVHVSKWFVILLQEIKLLPGWQILCVLEDLFHSTECKLVPFSAGPVESESDDWLGWFPPHN